jgi:hypothetical protein
MATDSLFPIFSQGVGYGIVIGLGELAYIVQHKKIQPANECLRCCVCNTHESYDLCLEKIHVRGPGLGDVPDS